MRVIVVVGASLAGLRAVETLRHEGFDGRIQMIGDEPHQPYDRPPLSKGLLTGSVDESSVALRHEPDLEIEWLLGERALALDTTARMVTLTGGRRVGYDGLVIATGATPRRLPTVPQELAGVMSLRTLDDALLLRRRLEGSPSVVVIGGGFIGTELASSCRTLGLDVTLVTLEPVLGRALGPLADSAARRAADYGVRVLQPATVGAVRGHGTVEEVVLSDGRVLPADVVVVAVGAVPATQWLEGSAVPIDNGVVCDAAMGVPPLPDVVAAGDVACWPHPALDGGLLRLEHWTNACEQATAAARRLLHGPTVERYAPIPSFWSDQFGTRLQGYGLPALADETRIIEGDPSGPRFVAEHLRKGEVVSVVAAGSPRALISYRARLSTFCAPSVVP